ncbi:eukaryotic translation initiation factor 3 subunit C-like [Temnothorax curvispinosus]|uniref:Eukaryotic translation initiation factor 3 subunit C-like n=1 Tax=Temnothorax curvispinosus TaxID=300111 RepID=A0A6J1QVW6_9HYME|nr:eukaryotic translation initiation factor 3 subunit C-like [Temnothorax curvispinosus]
MSKNNSKLLSTLHQKLRKYNDFEKNRQMGRISIRTTTRKKKKADEITESEEEEDSALAFKKAGSEASKPDVRLRSMAKMAVKANLTGTVTHIVRAQVAMTKTNIKIFASISSRRL